MMTEKQAMSPRFPLEPSRKAAWLERLDEIQPESDDGASQLKLEQMSFASTLLILTQINHDREFTICLEATRHLLGKVPEPDDADLGESWADPSINEAEAGESTLEDGDR